MHRHNSARYRRCLRRDISRPPFHGRELCRRLADVDCWRHDFAPPLSAALPALLNNGGTRWLLPSCRGARRGEHPPPSFLPIMSSPKRIWIIIAFAALYLIWGSTYLAILFAIRSIPPLL